jgi:hypothetical protein
VSSLPATAGQRLSSRAAALPTLHSARRGLAATKFAVFNPKNVLATLYHAGVFEAEDLQLEGVPTQGSPDDTMVPPTKTTWSQVQYHPAKRLDPDLGRSETHLFHSVLGKWRNPLSNASLVPGTNE